MLEASPHPEPLIDPNRAIAFRAGYPYVSEAVDIRASEAEHLGVPCRVLFVTPEIADFVKVGGLGEVSAALPRSLLANCDVRVLVPGYRPILARIYVVLCDELYDREGTPYNDAQGGDFADGDIRFARLSLAAADMAAGLGDPDWKPDLIHANDWPAALAPAYAKWRGARTSSLLTVHNLGYQGVFDAHRRHVLGIPDAAFSIEGAEFYGKLSFFTASCPF
jgi:starch synthase